MCICYFMKTISDFVGQCVCKAFVQGLRCDSCKDGYQTLGSDPLNGCSSCGCNPAGVLEASQQCDKELGECTCKRFVQGRTCDECMVTLPYNDFNLLLVPKVI